MRDQDPFPSGTVTFLFTDIQGSTKLAQEHPQEMPELLARHNAILNGSIETQHGFVFRIVGDSFSAAFHTAREALSAALEAQRRLQNESWSPAPINVRMGIHTGSAQLQDDPQGQGTFYEGYGTLALTQRIMSVGHGGQILLSQTTHDLVKDRLPDGTELRDMGERRLKDIVRPEHIYQVAASDLPSDFPPLTTLEAFHHNLPMQLTSFIGREQEIAEARKLLSDTRILTLIGPGGTGKSRLCLQVAAEQISEFKDGVWLIELAQLADPRYVLSTIASTFNLRELQGAPLIDTLTDYLRAKQLLLVLDNCEHLIETCARLSSHFVRACPNLKIIASSREALGINGETVYHVPSLSLPPAPAAGDGGEDGGKSKSLMDYESTRLFTERARQANPQFALTADNAPSVAQICTRLDGIPLAIELAAARLKLFTPQQIAERLDDRFKLLTGGSRSALPRQQTLRALIDWSYLTLNEMEQDVLRRLAVFSGGWTFDAAESVVGEMEVMDGLSGLVNKSLVNVEEQDGESRYRYLETIRQYAMEKLLESGEAVDIRDRHLAHFGEYTRRAEENFATAQRLLWLNRLEVEYDNIRSALGWALESHPEAALQMVCSLAVFWLSRSYLTEGSNWCQAAIARAEALSLAGPNMDHRRAQVYTALAMLSVNRGEHQTGQTAAKQGVALARGLDDKSILVRALNALGFTSVFLGEVRLAFDALHESEDICRKLGYREELANVLQALAYITMEVQGPDATEQLQSYMEESLALSQGSVDPEDALRTEGILARLAFYRSDLAEARKHADRMLDLHKKMGDQLGTTAHQSAMAHAARQLGNFEEALDLYRETIRDWQEIGHRGAVAHQLECIAYIAKAQEQGGRAVKLMSAADALREAGSSPRTPQERIEYDRELAGLRTGMDEEEFNLLWEEGQSMKMEQAIDFAVGEKKQ
ncbi:MAG TPA: adenylate/guanylate cyclase domain-containing protein [Anaerolineales bacterium]|nr:adenylate/guanylate cyclase domain-containing protein [Anaerolineales bacterium]